MEHSHAHGHEHHHEGRHARAARPASARRLLWVMLFGGIILVAEVVAGFLANSLVLLSDAAHMSTDVAALALAYAAMRISSWAPTTRKSYGYYRAETVAAFVNALVLWGLSAYFVWEAWRRLQSPPAVDGLIVTAVGGISLAANLVMAAVLHRDHQHSINMRGAYLHVLSDAVGSLAALIAGLGVMFYDARWLDPATTLIIAVLLILWTWRLTRDTLHILLEGTPASVDHEKVRASIETVPGVLRVHDLHVWSLTTGVDNLSAHVHVADPAQGPYVVKDIRARLRHDHNISHITIEVETEDSDVCEGCN